MDRSRDEFFARAALPGDENGCIGGRDANDAPENVPNLRGLSGKIKYVVSYM